VRWRATLAGCTGIVHQHLEGAITLTQGYSSGAVTWLGVWETLGNGMACGGRKWPAPDRLHAAQPPWLMTNCVARRYSSAASRTRARCYRTPGNGRAPFMAVAAEPRAI